MKLRFFRTMNAILITNLAFFLFSPALVIAGEADQAAYESFKGAYDTFKGIFKGTKEKVDGTTEFFGNFNSNMSQWRKACSEEMQDEAIENITDMTKEQMGAIDDLAAKLSEMTGMDIPENIPAEIKSKLSAKLLGSLSADQAKKYGYMYTLSSFDRKLRDNGVYEKLGALKEQFDAGEELLGSIDNAVEFVDTFNPNGDGTPTNSLKKIKGVLDYMGKFTEEFPLIGKIIEGYAQATEHFIAALDDLDKKLKDSRQGSLGGQIGVDIAIKNKIFAEAPEVAANEGLTWFSINGEYPALAPIRGWRDRDVVLYHGSDSGDGLVAFINGAAFEKLYKYYVALKKSDIAGNKKLVDPDTFIAAARAIGSKSLDTQDKRFREDYALFEGANNREFLEVLEVAGCLNEEKFLVSTAERVMEYRIYMQKEDEFCGLEYFNKQFRNDISSLRYKYQGKMAVTGVVRAKPDSPRIGDISILINSQPAIKFKRKSDSECSYGTILPKGQEYSINIGAKGFKRVNKSNVKETYLVTEIEPTHEGKVQAKINGLDSITVETKNDYTIEFDSNTFNADKLKVKWTIDGVAAGEGKTVSVTASKVGKTNIAVYIYSPDGAVSKGYFQKPVEVVNLKSDYGITLTVPSKTVVSPQQSCLITGKIAATKKVYFQSLSTTVKDETSGKILRNDSWFSPDQLKNPSSSEVNVSFQSPAIAGEYPLTFTLKGKTGKVEEVISIQKVVYVVPTVVINCPDSVNATDMFDVNVVVPAEMPGTVADYAWNPYDSIISGSDWGRTKTANVRMQIRNDQVQPGNKVEISCYMQDAKNKTLAIARKTVTVLPVSFGTTAPGNWTGGPGEFKRTPAVRKRTDKGKEIDSATVSGTINVTMERGSNSVFYDPKKMQKSFEEQAAKWGSKVEKITIGNFTGSFAESPFTSRVKGHWEYGDVGFPEASASGSALLFCGQFYMQISYSVSGSGFRGGQGPNFWWDDLPFILAETKAAREEAKGIILGLTLKPDGKIEKGPEKKPTVLPSLKITADKTKLRKGETAEVLVTVENAEPEDQPFTYTWNGSFAGKGPGVTFLATAPGSQSLAVNVVGKRFAIGTASVTFQVEDVTAKIEKTTPAANSVMVGSAASFKASVLMGGKPGSGNFVYRWQPNSELKFEPTEDGSPVTSTKFTKPGKIKIWVEVLESKNGTLATLATSDQIEMDVTKPGLKLVLTPTTPLVGQEIKARVEETPAMKEIDFRWDMPANAKLLSESQDSKERIFYALNTTPIKVTAKGRVPFSGEDLGEATATVTAKAYKINVKVLGPIGPKPMIWKSSEGLVEDKTAIATFQNVNLKVEIEPAPKETVTYNWTLNSGSSFGGGSTGTEVMVQRGEKGTAEAKVEVKNSNGVILGTGQGSFSVTISQNDIQKAKDKDREEKKKKEALGKLAQAKELYTQGKIEQAILLAEEAAKDDPKNQEIIDFLKKIKADKDKINQQLTKTREMIDQGKIPEAQKEYDLAVAINGKFQPVIDMGKTLAIARVAAEKAAKNAADKKAKEDADKTAKDAADKKAAADKASADKAAVEKKAAETGKSVETKPGTSSAKGLPSVPVVPVVPAVPGAAVKPGETKIPVPDAAAIKLAAEKAAAEKLIKEAEVLAKDKKYQEAIKKYQESIKIYRPFNIDAINTRIFNLQYTDANEQADKIRAAADKLKKEGLLEEAIAKYEKALQTYHLQYPFRQQLEVQTQDLRNIVNSARQFRQTGETNEKKGDINQAITDYENSLKLLKNAALRQHTDELIVQLNGDMAKAEGEKLEKKGDLKGAINQYEKALSIYAPSFNGRKKLETHIAELKKILATPPASGPAIASNEDQTGLIKQMYADFAKAYAYKNEARVMSYISPEWDAGDGTTLSDLRNYLRNSFTVFDEIQYTISGLSIKKGKNDTYQASYDVTIVGKIYDNNIKHEEKSSVNEELAIDAKGKAKVRKTMNGKFWYVE